MRIKPLLTAMLILSSSHAWAEGDPEYGEYLSSECVTCHLPKDHDGPIPTLHGYNKESFVILMELYRAKELPNPTMQTIASRLTDEDIAALAAYFSAQKVPE